MQTEKRPSVGQGERGIIEKKATLACTSISDFQSMGKEITVLKATVCSICFRNPSI